MYAFTHTAYHLPATLLAALPATIQSQTILAVLLLICLFIAFSLAGAQGVIFSLQDDDVDVLKTKHHTAARRIISLLNEPKEVFTSILIGKTLLNICIIVLCNSLVSAYVPLAYQSGIYIAVKYLAIALFIIFFVEIFPRVWATQSNLRFAYEWPFLIWVAEMVHLALRRVSHSMVLLAQRFERGVGADKLEENNLQDLDKTIDTQAAATANTQEKDILKGIVKFGKISVKKVMRSRLYVSGIEHSTSFAGVLQQIEALHYSRLPVYKNNLDEIAGILNTKDLLGHIYDENYNWHSLIRPPFFVPESKLIEDLLHDFQKKHIHFAVVVDEFGGTSGIITMEDILEEVIGDIKDEFDDEENVTEQIDDTTYVFEGRTTLLDACKAMHVAPATFDAVSGGAESVGGLINELSGDLPKAGDIFNAAGYEIAVLTTDKNRVKTVKFTLK